MKAYVEIIQRKERELGTDVLTHQKVCLMFFSSPKSLLNRSLSGVEQIMPITLSKLSQEVYHPQRRWAKASRSRSFRASFDIDMHVN
jgi:hypothetical protein